ncbi:transcription factor [Ganoderma sinense ZZ0214-1]|uniref:Transcription factor n=1 Tax=Ganoderma sinense ZZ0214-1 TaxID=1077348 RepID=A0A2G8S1V9_9APHY|nr:transcription factor [Ganoderma sinense ZZ0214-1]
MPECAHCHRVLKNESALIQHCKDKGHPYPSALASKPAVPAPAPASKVPTAVPSSSTVVASSSTVPYECKPCGVSYRDKPSLDQHNATRHPPKPFKCVPCGVDFSTTDAFSIHLRTSPKHPKCPQCNSGFLDETQLKLHQARHQKCVQCGSVFTNKTQLEEHVESAHPQAVACACGREYAPSDRQKHYPSVVGPPGGAMPTVGFADDETCDGHMETNHPRPVRVPSPPPRSPSPIPRVLPQTNFASSMESQAPARSTQSSPLVQRAALAVQAVAFLTEVKMIDRGGQTYQTVEASSHVQRAISEPTVPTVSSIGKPYHDEMGWVLNKT